MSRAADSAGSPKGAGLQSAAPISVYIVDVDAAVAALEAMEQETPRLAADQIARFEHSKQARGLDEARRWRGAHIALRLALERAAGPRLRGIPYEIEPGGRPRLSRAAGLSSIPDFSLAHAGSAALIGISQIGAVGVDIEVPRPFAIGAERRQRLEQAARQLAPGASLPDEPDARFLQAWVRLEAVAKATGLGIGRILTEAGVVGGASGRDRAATESGGAVRDLDAGDGRFAAISAAELPQILIVQGFPETHAALAKFAG